MFICCVGHGHDGHDGHDDHDDHDGHDGHGYFSRLRMCPRGTKTKDLSSSL